MFVFCWVDFSNEPKTQCLLDLASKLWALGIHEWHAASPWSLFSWWIAGASTLKLKQLLKELCDFFFHVLAFGELPAVGQGFTCVDDMCVSACFTENKLVYPSPEMVRAVPFTKLMGDYLCQLRTIEQTKPLRIGKGMLWQRQQVWEKPAKSQVVPSVPDKQNRKNDGTLFFEKCS